MPPHTDTERSWFFWVRPVPLRASLRGYLTWHSQFRRSYLRNAIWSMKHLPRRMVCREVPTIVATEPRQPGVLEQQNRCVEYLLKGLSFSVSFPQDRPNYIRPLFWQKYVLRGTDVMWLRKDTIQHILPIACLYSLQILLIRNQHRPDENDRPMPHEQGLSEPVIDFKRYGHNVTMETVNAGTEPAT